MACPAGPIVPRLSERKLAVLLNRRGGFSVRDDIVRPAIRANQLLLKIHLYETAFAAVERPPGLLLEGLHQAAGHHRSTKTAVTTHLQQASHKGFSREWKGKEKARQNAALKLSQPELFRGVVFFGRMPRTALNPHPLHLLPAPAWSLATHRPSAVLHPRTGDRSQSSRTTRNRAPPRAHSPPTRSCSPGSQ